MSDRVLFTATVAALVAAATGCCFDDRGCPVSDVLFTLRLEEPVTTDARLRATLNGALLAELAASRATECATSPEVVGAQLCLTWGGSLLGEVEFGSAPGDVTPADGDVLELEVRRDDVVLAYHAVTLDYEERSLCAGRAPCPPFAFVELEP